MRIHQVELCNLPSDLYRLLHIELGCKCVVCRCRPRRQKQPEPGDCNAKLCTHRSNLQPTCLADRQKYFSVFECLRRTRIPEFPEGPPHDCTDRLLSMAA